MYKDSSIEEKLKNWFLVYGKGCYNPSKFKKVRNPKYFDPILLKPETGGLWSSPKKSLWGWKDWCDSEMFIKGWGFSCGFKFKLKKSAKIYVINSIKDFEQLSKRFKIFVPGRIVEKYCIDWEELSLEYDGLFLTYEGYLDFRNNSRIEFYSWDCESLIIFNLDCISFVKSLRRCELLIHSHTYNQDHNQKII